ncbi:hypothetical protein D1007_00387 [Hordeum vulgare]|nr:hypothetical protein D1007_00387 [Hordeum vulgare]
MERGGLEDVGDFNQENLDIGSHMDHCSAQLRKIEMNDSDGEEDILMPEMVCLSEEMVVGIGSAKRSLLESLDMVEMEKKRKSESNKMKKWGPVLSSRPTTRQHGNVKIMDKATTYLQKKNLKIPSSFQGNAFTTTAVNVLASQITSIDLCMGQNEEEQSKIIQDLVLREQIRCLDFADQILKLFCLWTYTHLFMAVEKNQIWIMLLDQLTLMI